MKEKRITSIEIHNSSSGPFCADEIIAQRLILYRKGKIIQRLYNGLSNLPVEEYEYKADEVKMSAFFEFLESKVKIQEWKPDYSVMVCDGWHWECKIRHSDNSIKKVVGTVEPPPRGDLLQKQICKLTDFKVEPWLL